MALLLAALVQTSRQSKSEQQADLERAAAAGGAGRSGTAPSEPQDLYKVPFILLMSNNSISLVQMPLIENGNVTLLYPLPPAPTASQIGSGAGAVSAGEREEEEEVAAEDLQDDSMRARSSAEEEPRRSPRAGGRSGSPADGREPEQMPRTSLGKSEWQQIAVDREEVGPQSETSRKEAARNGRDEAEPEKEATGRGPRRGRGRRWASRRSRGRRSNSLTQAGAGDRGASSGSGGGDNNNIAGGEHYAGDVQESAGMGRPVAESGGPNVTSARPEAGSGQTEAAGDKNGAGAEGPAGGPSSATSSGAAVGGGGSSRRRGSDGLQFSDLDAHMELGYAFAADSAGRIHRFRLPTVRPPGSSSASSSGEGSTPTRGSDQSNSIEAEGAGQGRRSGWSWNNSNNNVQFDDVGGGGDDDEGATANKANKAEGTVASEEPSRHPGPVSGEGSARPDGARDGDGGAPISGASKANRRVSAKREGHLMMLAAESLNHRRLSSLLLDAGSGSPAGRDWSLPHSGHAEFEA